MIEGDKMPRVAFEADTNEELVERALRWALETLETSRRAQLGTDVPELDVIIARIHGVLARAFLRAVAERAIDGGALTLDEAAERFGRRPDPGAFVGLQGAANRPALRVAGRRLIEWDPFVRGYRMDPADARVVLNAVQE